MPQEKLAEVTEWYARITNIKPRRRGDGSEVLDFPGVEAPLVISKATGPVAPPPEALGHFGIEFKNLPGVYSTLERAGVKFIRPLMTFQPDRLAAITADPAGTVVQFTEHPSGTFFERPR